MCPKCQRQRQRRRRRRPWSGERSGRRPAGERLSRSGPGHRAGDELGKRSRRCYRKCRREAEPPANRRVRSAAAGRSCYVARYLFFVHKREQSRRYDCAYVLPILARDGLATTCKWTGWRTTCRFAAENVMVVWSSWFMVVSRNRDQIEENLTPKYIPSRLRDNFIFGPLLDHCCLLCLTS